MTKQSFGFGSILVRKLKVTSFCLVLTGLIEILVGQCMELIIKIKKLDFIATEN